MGYNFVEKKQNKNKTKHAHLRIFARKRANYKRERIRQKMQEELWTQTCK